MTWESEFEELNEMIKSAQSDEDITDMSYQEMKSIPKRKIVVEDTLGRPSLSAIVGQPGTGKSAFAMQKTICIASPNITTWHGLEIETGHARYLSPEAPDTHGERASAIEEMLKFKAEELPNFRFSKDQLDITSYPGLERLFRYLKNQNVPLKIVVIDTVTAASSKDLSTDKNLKIYLRILYQMAEFFDCCILLVHHSTKDGSTYLGQQAFAAILDTITWLKKDKATGKRTFECEKQRLMKEFDPRPLKSEDINESFVLVPDVQEPGDAAKSLLYLIKNKSPVQSDIAFNEFGRSATVFRKYRRQLMLGGYITYDDKTKIITFLKEP